MIKKPKCSKGALLVVKIIRIGKQEVIYRGYSSSQDQTSGTM
jgi:hypothetical protein